MNPRMLAAFPGFLAAQVRNAEEGLGPASAPMTDQLIQDSNHRRWGRVSVGGEELAVPYRHYQPALRPLPDPGVELVRQAWLTRSNDGRAREQALRALLDAPTPWHVPFVVQLCGEYVVEIGRLIADFTSRLAATHDPVLKAYRDFWTENPDFVGLTHARAASYWDVYHRDLSSLAEYPPYVALRQIESHIRRRSSAI